MIITSPADVLEALHEDLRRRGLSQYDVAKMTGYKTRQAIGTILTSGKYLQVQQALRFNAAFGYSIPFLTEGKGSLGGDGPKDFHDLLLTLDLMEFGDAKSFQGVFEQFMAACLSVFGEENTLKFATSLVQYLELRLQQGKSYASLVRKYYHDRVRHVSKDDPFMKDIAYHQRMLTLYDMFPVYAESLVHRDRKAAEWTKESLYSDNS